MASVTFDFPIRQRRVFPGHQSWALNNVLLNAWTSEQPAMAGALARSATLKWPMSWALRAEATASRPSLSGPR